MSKNKADPYNMNGSGKYWVLTVAGDLWRFQSQNELLDYMKDFPAGTWKWGCD